MNYKDRRLLLFGLIIVLQGLLFLGLLFIRTGDSVSVFTSYKDAVLLALDNACLLMSLIFYISIRRTDNSQPDAWALRLMIVTGTVYLLSDAIYRLVDEDPSHLTANWVSNTVYLICPVMMILFYWVLLDSWIGDGMPFYREVKRILHASAIIYILLIICNIKFHFLLDFNENAKYTRGSLYILTLVFPAAMTLLCAARIMTKKMPQTEQIVLLMYPLAPLLAGILQGIVNWNGMLAIATFFSTAYLYTNFYVKKELEYARVEKQLTESRLRSLQMQINPHTLFNTLTSMAGLCDVSPSLAKEMIYNLADYMRDNFTDIDTPLMVTLKEELTFLDHYMQIEEPRFPNITLEKNIGPSDFMLPRMILQPLVENSINHGIRKRKKSAGTITISTSETASEWRVSVKDDGVGFDTTKALSSDKEHYGIANVRTRLSILCNGRLDIFSEPGKGTEAMIVIPK